MSDNMAIARVEAGPMEMMQIGQVFFQSGYFSDAKSEAQAIVKIMAGRELGIPPVAAMTGIHIIEGKISVGAGLIASRVKGSGKYDYRILALDDRACRLQFYESGQPIGESSFTMEDAKRAGLAGKQNWQKYTQDMLFARALTRGARRYCPDIFSGPVYTADELQGGGAKVDAPPVIEGVLMPEPSACITCGVVVDEKLAARSEKVFGVIHCAEHGKAEKERRKAAEAKPAEPPPVDEDFTALAEAEAQGEAAQAALDEEINI